QAGQELHELFLGRVGRKPQVVRADADGGRGLLLARDVDVRGGVVADEHRGEADLAELLDLRGDLLANFRSERLAVDHVGGHRPERTGRGRDVRMFLIGRAKTKQGKDAGSPASDASGATEDAAMRRFAAVRADNILATAAGGPE